MKNKIYIISALLAITLILSCSGDKKSSDTKIESNGKASTTEQLAEYIRLFPFQDTYNYMKRYTGGEASKLNVWILGQEPILVKAGEDKVVRMNNDTYYKMAFMDLSQGLVTLGSNSTGDDRFYSFQIMDDHNANFKNVINPNGDYHIYYGEAPTGLEGELIKSPSEIAVVIVRVEVKDLNNEDDLMQAKNIFAGISINGSVITEFPGLDLFNAFDESIITEGNRLLDSAFQNTPFRLTVASPDQIPNEVPYLNFAAGTKGGWGGPVTSHSSYETIFFDVIGETLDGSKGDYSITTPEPPVDAFWSVTIYDTERGGYLHPNTDNKYHINGTTVVKNEDGTITFLFKKSCESGDQNCLEIPANTFDYVVRYYLPSDEIRSGEWEMSKAAIIK